jgi:hypothetical protein
LQVKPPSNTAQPRTRTRNRQQRARPAQTRRHPQGMFQPPCEGKIGINAEARKNCSILDLFWIGLLHMPTNGALDSITATGLPAHRRSKGSAYQLVES